MKIASLYPFFVFFVLKIASFGLTAPLNAQCDSTFIYKGIYEGHAYFYSTATLSWEDANTAASALGGHLVTISNTGENTFVATQVVEGNLAWIGLNDATSEGVFVWPNNEPFGYTNWGNGEPNNAGNENWVEINRNDVGKWNDMPAGFPRRFVVEFDQGDTDLDGIPNVCDTCPLDANNDEDGDGFCSNIDNCPTIVNTDQADLDSDGLGDACDLDSDNDGCSDQNDANPLIFSLDSDCDGVSDDCDYCAGGDDKGPCNASAFQGFDQLSDGWLCGDQKVYVCQQGKTLCISPNAVQAYLDQGDFLGPCVSCDLAHTFQFEMFPNPAAQEVTIFLNGLEDQSAKLTFFDNLGRLVLQKNIPAGLRFASVNFNLNEFAPGPYYVGASTQNTTVTKKLVVAR